MTGATGYIDGDRCRGCSTPAPSSPEGEELSPHLRSRAEVAEILLASGVSTAVLRAAVVLGSGAAWFELLRYLVGCATLPRRCTAASTSAAPTS